MFRIKLKDNESTRPGQYRQYSPTTVINAMEKIRSHEMSIYKASKNYGIPETTLRDRAAGRISIETLKSGPPPLFSLDEEARLAKHLEFMASLGFGYTRSEPIEIGSQYASECGKRTQQKPLSRQWYTSFIRRWPGLQLKKSRNLSLLRAKSTTQDKINKYFTDLESIMRKYDLLDNPHCIYNIDEKGACPDKAPSKVVARVGSMPPCVTSERSLTVTIIGCGNAVGTQIPPFLIFPEARMRSELLEGCTAGCDGDVSASGWSNSEIFKRYMKEHFIKYVQGLTPNQKILALYDGHKSHISIELIDWAKEHNIILFVLPAHTSHLLQPLDVGCFAPLSRIPNSACHSYMRANHTNITRYTIGRLATKAYVQALSAENLKSAFRKTGIYPLDSKVIQPEVLLPSTIENKTQAKETGDNTPTDTTNDSVIVDKTGETVNKQTTDNSDNFNAISAFVERLEHNVGKSGTESVKKRNVLSRVVAGKPITEDDILFKIQEHCKKNDSSKKVNERKRPSVSSKKGKENKGKSRVKRKCVKGQQEGTTATENKTPRMMSNSQKPGPSGLQKIIISDDEFSSESDDLDEEKCCVCGLSAPVEFKKGTSLLILNWGQCMYGECKHWTHLRFCCDVNALRRHSVFYCPCHGVKCLQA